MFPYVWEQCLLSKAVGEILIINSASGRVLRRVLPTWLCKKKKIILKLNTLLGLLNTD